MVLKQLGMASVSIQAGVEGFLELEPNSNTRFLSGRTVYDLVKSHLVSALRAPTAEQNEKFWLSAEQNPKEPAQHYQKQQTKVVGLGCSIE